MMQIVHVVEYFRQHQLLIDEQFINPNEVITGKPITDSRSITKGDIFFCIKGLVTDGHNYIGKVCENGASLIIQEDEFTHKFPAIRVTDSRKATALYAKLFFNNPSEKFKLIGVTGTNGKTTTSFLLYQAISNLGYKTGWIGTLGYLIDQEIIPTNNTTPDIIELNTILKSMADEGCQYVVMEVSSHALAMDRVFGLEFALALFTNLTRDHLDFHKDMNEYFECKYRLFDMTMKNNGISIVNIDDKYGKIIYERISTLGNYQKYSVSEVRGNFTVVNYSCNIDHCSLVINESDTLTYNFNTKLIGHYNQINLTMTFAAIKILFPDVEKVALTNVVNALQPVRGRLEQIQNLQHLGVFIDYAHTPDAIKNVLMTLNELEHKRIITVLGAGGDRDKGKRPDMLKIAMQYSNAVIITDDNPRTENPNQIIRDIVSGVELWQPWWIIRDREQAIRSALILAQPHDIVLITGKGHENYQEYNGVRSRFDDVETVKKYLNINLIKDKIELSLPIDSLLLEILYQSIFQISDNESVLFKNVTTDSREIKNHSLFFAIKGDKFDGNNFVEEVLKEPSNGAVISDKNVTELNTIFFKNATQALGLLARKYLLMFSARKIAITGSTGKTTTKEYMANIFEQAGKILKTYANENNIIGLSKTIFKIKPDISTAIFELGTNRFGEINELAEICDPDIALITSIGPSHLEFLENEEGVYREKTALFRRDLISFLYPSDDLRFIEFKNYGKSVGFLDGSSYRIKNVNFHHNKIVFDMNEDKWEVNQQIPYFVMNIAFSIATAKEAGISNNLIQFGLNKRVDLNFRMEISMIGGLTIINDSYNANPTSMKAAINFWQSYIPEADHYAVLGDMLELGSMSKKLHQDIGSILSKIHFRCLITVGDLAWLYAKNEKGQSIIPQTEHLHYSLVDEIDLASLSALMSSKCVLLIKGSHGVHLEKFVENLMRTIRLIESEAHKGD